LNYIIVAGALIFLFNIAMTIFKARRFTAIQGTLLGGLTFLALLYLFAGALLLIIDLLFIRPAKEPA
jgi:hypothetical protein